MVIGAGIGGLVASLLLAASGREVVVLERAGAVGGKMREVEVGGAKIDSGPTVFTLRGVFDAIFAAAGARLDDHVRLREAGVLARHAWEGGARLDLFADPRRSEQAIGEAFGAADARGFRAFDKAAAEIWSLLEESFVRAPEPSLPRLMASQGLFGAQRLMAIRPFTGMMSALGSFFRDPRLAQLFGRYATYTGSNPYEAPATLILIAHVERCGVHLVEGGMQRLAEAIAALAIARGAQIRTMTGVREIRVANGRVAGVVTEDGEAIAAQTIVANADAGAIAAGILGRDAAGAVPAMRAGERSLSAVTMSMRLRTHGFPLSHHNVFFSPDYAAEFSAIFGRGQLPADPTVYVCAPDRDDLGADPEGPERLFTIVNAPARGDTRPFTNEEISACEAATFRRLERLGLGVERRAEHIRTTNPNDFERMFPGTGGALYGRASHGWNASFERPTARTRLPGLYLAGGSAHPGAGVPMAALSGWSAAHLISRDTDSSARSRTTAMSGGTSTS